MALSMKTLSEINSVSGDEAAVRELILNEIKHLCDFAETDSMGNIIALKKGKSDKYRLMIGTNIDEAGFIVSEITEKGYLKIKSVGAIDSRTLISKCVLIGKKRIKGVIGMKAIHLQKKTERENAVELSQLYIDIGAKDKKTAEKEVKLGDYVTFATEFAEYGGVIKGKALDRFGVFCMVDAMKTEPAYDTYFVFSTQREIPSRIAGRGMMTAAFKVQPDYAVIINTTDSGDTYKSKSPSAKLGGGAVIEYMDKTSISSAVFTSAVREKALENSILMQEKTSSVSLSITGAAQQYGAVCACVGIPCRYSHTPVCLMNQNDIASVTELIKIVVKESDVIIDGAAEKIDRS